jgi:DNA modification methylase
MNTLFYGDNLEILRRHVDDDTVDLVYLDPPFNSNANYNLLFAEQDGTRSAAQIRAFKDTWRWDTASAKAFEEVVESGHTNVSLAMQAFRQALGCNNMLAYLSMMAPRLIELRRVMKPTATLYLHCDPTASHYLKMLLDAIFGPRRILNEITWKRSSAHSDTKQGMRRCGKIRDILLVYTKSDEYTWNPQYTPYTEAYLESEYRHKTKDGRFYKQTDLTAAKPGGDTEYDWPVKRPVGKTKWEPDLTHEFEKPKDDWEYKQVRPYDGRYWAYSIANLTEFAKAGKLHHRKTGMPRLMQYADEMPGIVLQDLWDDISPELGNRDLGYPTQKPEALLERILMASSNEGDVVLDPFCGCGTAIAVAHKLHRQWIGIDITHLAIALLRFRLKASFGDVEVSVVGEPEAETDAAELAANDPYQFQCWVLGKVGARPAEVKKGADRGIDGRLFFHDEGESRETKQVVFSVKGGKLQAGYVRDLVGVVNREKAAVAVMLSLHAPTKKMYAEAAEAGFYESRFGSKHPRVQLLTVADLFAGKTIDLPNTRDFRTFATAKPTKKAARKSDKQQKKIF